MHLDARHTRERGRLWAWLAAALLVVFGVLVFYDEELPLEPSPRFALEVELATSRSGTAQLFFDRGRGFRLDDSSSVEVEQRTAPAPVRFGLQQGAIRRLRLDYLNGVDASATIGRIRVIDTSTGKSVASIRADRFEPNPQIATREANGDVVTVSAQPGAVDPYLVATFAPPLPVGLTPFGRFLRQTPWWALLFGAAWGVARAIDWIQDDARGAGIRAALVRSWRRKPRWWLAGTAAAATVLCCHPVLFGGRSLFSGYYDLPLFHSDYPDKARHPENYEDANSSDTGAMFWQHLPYSFVHYEALRREGVFPWWNRYVSCGQPLFGQGQSMLGDPLHLPVILARGAWWAWDAKYIVARFLFALGIGLAAYAATRRAGVSALLAAVAPFIGFFSFRLNHPAYVSLCYSPWLLVGWLELARPRPDRSSVGWLALVVVANWCMVTSGTVKEAAMFVATLNLAGIAAVLVAGDIPPAQKRRLLGTAAALGACGALMLAPWWMAFRSTLQFSWTAYIEPFANRAALLRFAGLFDGMLASEYYPDHAVAGPSANAVVFLGILALVTRPWILLRDRLALVLLAALAGVLSLGFAVPWLTNACILAVPGLRNVGNVGTVFLTVAVPLLFAAAARGFAADGDGTRRRWVSATAAGILAAFVLGPLLADLWARWSPADHAAPVWRTLAAHSYFVRSLLGLALGSAAVLVGMTWMRTAPGRLGAGAVLIIAGLVPLLARHGQMPPGAHGEYFVNPALASNIAAPSPALESLQARAKEPFRLFGLDGHIMPGFSALHRIEEANGPDALQSRYYRELSEAAGLVPAGNWLMDAQPHKVIRHQRIYDLFNVRYYATCRNAPPPMPWTSRVIDLDLLIHESPTAWPRAFFTDAIETYTSPLDIVERARSGDGRPFAAMVPEDVPAALAGARRDGGAARSIQAATEYVLGNNSTEFVIDAPGSGLAVLQETWWPDFVAMVDGAPADVLRVNHAFKGVRIASAGIHRVRFEFRPRWFPLSLVLALAGTVGTVALLWVAGRKDRTRGLVRSTAKAGLENTADYSGSRMP